MVNLICIIILIVVFYYFNNFLGTRTGPQRPLDYGAKGRAREPLKAEEVTPHRNEEVLTEQEQLQAIDQLAASNASNNEVKAGLKAIAQADKSFDIMRFQSSAKLAYEMILTAFAKGDESALRPLLDEALYGDFIKAIRERQARGERVEFTFVGVNKLQFLAAQLIDGEANISLAFRSEIISATYNKEGELIEGDSTSLSFIEDEWTFARIINSSQPNWRLIATEFRRADELDAPIAQA